MSIRPERSPSRQERRYKAQRKRERAARLKKFTGPSLWVLLALVVVGLITFLSVTNRGIANSAYPPVNNISCDQGEHSDFHIHAHLTMYINGKQTTLPAGVGIAPDGSCLYWLHTHNTDGVIHIEAPKGASFTLNNFLEIWSGHFQSLGFPNQLNTKTGWQVYVDGKPFAGDFHTIPLQAHMLITLAYHSPGIHPDTFYNWNGL
ncbi:MAG: hypothetical protein ACRDHZ_04550 [Ktedonobacteraceae bacterium]